MVNDDAVEERFTSLMFFTEYLVYKISGRKRYHNCVKRRLAKCLALAEDKQVAGSNKR